jgi:hypothetical protein
VAEETDHFLKLDHWIASLRAISVRQAEDAHEC